MRSLNGCLYRKEVTMSEREKKHMQLQINAKLIENGSNYALFNEGMRKGSEIASDVILPKYQELETYLRKFIDMCSSPCVIDEEGFNDELNDLIMRSKLLLKGGNDD